MGLMRFIVSPPDRMTEETVEQAYLSGLDRIPWKVQTRVAEGQLILERPISESASLHIPWDVPGFGRLVLSTASLMEREQPYHLPLELARGKIGQVRNQLADWQSIGLQVPATVVARLDEAVEALGRAAVTRNGALPSVPQAQEALRLGVEAAQMLAFCYTEQALAVRRRVNGKLPAALAGDLGTGLLDDNTAGLFLQTFNAAVIPFAWREIVASEGAYAWSVTDTQVEWSRAHGLGVYGGPLIQLDRAALPDWLYVWEGEFDDILSFVCEYVQAVVTRYRGKIGVWQCAGRLNSLDALGLSEEETLRLAARVIELVRALDPDTPVVISFDQPWAEYMNRRELDFPPLHFADALVRAGLGLSGLMLEMNVGFHPGGTLTRDPMDVGRQLDHWSLLGLPLHVAVCVPSSPHDDPLARRRVRMAPESWSVKTQQSWVAQVVPLLLAKPYVQGVIWNQLRDCEPHEFPHGGLFDLRRQPKPALRTLTSIRQAHLK
jgi:hypothetical protein